MVIMVRLLVITWFLKKQPKEHSSLFNGNDCEIESEDLEVLWLCLGIFLTLDNV
jgi:hypothetical protein